MGDLEIKVAETGLPVFRLNRWNNKVTDLVLLALKKTVVAVNSKPFGFRPGFQYVIP